MQANITFSVKTKMATILPDSTFTCISNAHGTTSWLDHCVTSVTGLGNIESVTVIDDYVCSDHLPLKVVVRSDLATNHHCVSGRNRNDFIDWKTAGVHDYEKFDVKSSEYLSNVDVSISLFNCTDQSCKLHEGEIDRLYGDIIKSLNMAPMIVFRVGNLVLVSKQQVGMTLLKSHMRLQGATLNSGVLMVNPDMDMCMRQCAEVDLISNMR